jgi:hypothetical protein
VASRRPAAAFEDGATFEAGRRVSPIYFARLRRLQLAARFACFSRDCTEPLRLRGRLAMWHFV